MNDSTYPEQPIRYAGFWKRANAYGYDVIVVQLGVILFLLALFPLPTMEQLVQLDPAIERWINRFTYLCIIASALYNILMIASPKQATLGKQFCGIKVVNTNGTPLTLVQSTLRHVLSGTSMVSGGLGFISIPFTREKVALHDVLASTRVILRAPLV